MFPVSSAWMEYPVSLYQTFPLCPLVIMGWVVISLEKSYECFFGFRGFTAEDYLKPYRMTGGNPRHGTHETHVINFRGVLTYSHEPSNPRKQQNPQNPHMNEQIINPKKQKDTQETQETQVTQDTHKIPTRYPSHIFQGGRVTKSVKEAC